MLLGERKEISAALIKNVYLGKEGKEWMLLEIFQEYNDVVERPVRREKKSSKQKLERVI